SPEPRIRPRRTGASPARAWMAESASCMIRPFNSGGEAGGFPPPDPRGVFQQGEGLSSWPKYSKSAAGQGRQAAMALSAFFHIRLAAGAGRVGFADEAGEGEDCENVRQRGQEGHRDFHLHHGLHYIGAV